MGPDRCERLARAVVVMAARSISDLRACALATMVSDPGQMSTFDRVFAALFGAPPPPGGQLPPVEPAFMRDAADGGPEPATQSQTDPGAGASGMRLVEASPVSEDGDEPLAEAPATRRVASAAELLRP